jgi:RNA polymerase sigma-70 factor, ECF subfamily
VSPAVPDPDSDRELARRAAVGDRSAIESLLRAHHDRIWGLCRKLTGNAADADDATQEALIAIVRGLPRFDGRAAFGTWAYRVATNACLDELRRRRRRPLIGLDSTIDPVRSGDVAEQAAAAVDIDAALSSLPLEQRAPIVLRDLCGLDYAEIGEVLSIPPGTVRSRIARGRAALAAHLDPSPPPVDGNHDPLRPRPTPSS